MKQIETALNRLDTSLSDIDGILVTHEHSDHTKGLPIMAKHLSCPIYAQQAVAKEMYLRMLRNTKQYLPKIEEYLDKN